MVTSGSDATLDLSSQGCPHAGVLVLSRFTANIDPFYLLGVFNSPVFWAFVQETMPTMGNGRHVLRRGPLAQFPVVIPQQSTQAEIATQVRQRMEAAAENDRANLERAIGEAVVRLFECK